ncbi:manganese efflux pump [Aneurinibacillus sp. Ricciae_BoGa-3]|uniref:manganese efflux pump n=1 Tax=Aneurinibacillus sp. Ricciae_BoGa-3 TaxID=3022697 RepID=UPI003FA4878D
MSLGNFFAILSIGIASNLDNAGASIAYGIRKIRIPWFSNFIISLMGFFLTLVGGIFGKWMALWLKPSIGNLIGMIVLVIIGICLLYPTLLNSKSVRYVSTSSPILKILRNKDELDLDGSKTLGFGESILLGISLSVNNLVGGFDVGVTHLSIWGISFISGVLSYVCVGLCAYLGSRFAAEKLGKQASFMAGILLILVGLHQIF